jgi:hypothetical protein
MDRDDAGTSDRSEEARRGDTGMIGSEAEDPGPGRDTSLTDPDPVSASTEQPRGTVAMSEGDPMRTRLGSHVEGAGAIGHDVVAAEEGTTHDTPADDRPGYAPERTADPGVGVAAAGERFDDAGPSDRSAFADEPGPTDTARSAFATEDVGAADRSTVASEDPARFGAGDAAPAVYAGEEAELTGRPEYADRIEGGDQPLYQEEPQRMDRPGGGGSLFTDEEPERLDRPGPQEPGVEQGVYDQEAERARRPSDGV